MAGESKSALTDLRSTNNIARFVLHYRRCPSLNIPVKMHNFPSFHTSMVFPCDADESKEEWP